MPTSGTCSKPRVRSRETRLKGGEMLVLEVKGQDSAENQTKREFLDEWVRAVNAHGAFDRWSWAVSRAVSDLPDLLQPAAGV